MCWCVNGVSEVLLAELEIGETSEPRTFYRLRILSFLISEVCRGNSGFFRLSLCNRVVGAGITLRLGSAPC